jgi:hypothetical protein
MRYIRLSNAAVAISDEQPISTPKAPREPLLPTGTYWARNVMRGKLGTYIAIRVSGEQMWVGVRDTNALAWVKADKALSTSEAQAWFKRAGFSR